MNKSQQSSGVVVQLIPITTTSTTPSSPLPIHHGTNVLGQQQLYEVFDVVERKCKKQHALLFFTTTVRGGVATPVGTTQEKITLQFVRNFA